MSEGVEHEVVLTKEAADYIKQKIWDRFIQSDFDNGAEVIKLACNAVDALVED